MCQTIVYVNDEVFLKNVTNIEFKNNQVKFTTLFEGPQILEGKIKSIDLINGLIRFKSKRRRKNG